MTGQAFGALNATLRTWGTQKSSPVSSVTHNEITPDVPFIGLGMVLASIRLSVLTSTRDDEPGMLSGRNTTGHEIGDTLGIVVLVTIATAANPVGPLGPTRLDMACWSPVSAARSHRSRSPGPQLPADPAAG